MCKQVSFLMIAALVLSAAMAGVATAGGSGLAGWWKLDDASGTVAVDSSGNGNDGALQGNGTWIEGVLDGAWQGDVKRIYADFAY